MRVRQGGTLFNLDFGNVEDNIKFPPVVSRPEKLIHIKIDEKLGGNIRCKPIRDGLIPLCNFVENLIKEFPLKGGFKLSIDDYKAIFRDKNR